jgi:hypothetical protein
MAFDVKLFSDMLITIIEMSTFNLNINLNFIFIFLNHLINS